VEIMFLKQSLIFLIAFTKIRYFDSCGLGKYTVYIMLRDKIYKYFAFIGYIIKTANTSEILQRFRFICKLHCSTITINLVFFSGKIYMFHDKTIEGKCKFFMENVMIRRAIQNTFL
jgi:hypothetical protein